MTFKSAKLGSIIKLFSYVQVRFCEINTISSSSSGSAFQIWLKHTEHTQLVVGKLVMLCAMHCSERFFRSQPALKTEVLIQSRRQAEKSYINCSKQDSYTTSKACDLQQLGILQDCHVVFFRTNFMRRI